MERLYVDFGVGFILASSDGHLTGAPGQIWTHEIVVLQGSFGDKVHIFREILSNYKKSENAQEERQEEEKKKRTKKKKEESEKSNK
jgi:hypothetical protein